MQKKEKRNRKWFLWSSSWASCFGLKLMTTGPGAGLSARGATQTEPVLLYVHGGPALDLDQTNTGTTRVGFLKSLIYKKISSCDGAAASRSRMSRLIKTSFRAQGASESTLMEQNSNRTDWKSRLRQTGPSGSATFSKQWLKNLDKVFASFTSMWLLQRSEEEEGEEEEEAEEEEGQPLTIYWKGSGLGPSLKHGNRKYFRWRQKQRSKTKQ